MTFCVWFCTIFFFLILDDTCSFIFYFFLMFSWFTATKADICVYTSFFFFLKHLRIYIFVIIGNHYFAYFCILLSQFHFFKKVFSTIVKFQCFIILFIRRFYKLSKFCFSKKEDLFSEYMILLIYNRKYYLYLG